MAKAAAKKAKKKAVKTSRGTAQRAKAASAKAKKPIRKAASKKNAPLRREVVHIPGGREHKNPVPALIRMGNMLFSASISGQKPVTDEVSPDPAEQIALAFGKLRQAVEAAGGTTGNIARINFYIPESGPRKALTELINREWLAMFPDAEDRPVRKVYPMDIPEGLVIQLDFIAVL
jgi:enamine deaminase RidA (YjgF/YER057c/UK114 family)